MAALPSVVLSVDLSRHPLCVYSEARGQESGTRYVHLGREAYRDGVERRTEAPGGIYYWLWGIFDSEDILARSGLAAVRDGFRGRYAASKRPHQLR